MDFINTVFQKVLVPERTDTAWKIDAGQLIKLLSFVYPWINSCVIIQFLGSCMAMGGKLAGEKRD